MSQNLAILLCFLSEAKKIILKVVARCPEAALNFPRSIVGIRWGEYDRNKTHGEGFQKFVFSCFPVQYIHYIQFWR